VVHLVFHPESRVSSPPAYPFLCVSEAELPYDVFDTALTLLGGRNRVWPIDGGISLPIAAVIISRSRCHHQRKDQPDAPKHRSPPGGLLECSIRAHPLVANNRRLICGLNEMSATRLGGAGNKPCHELPRRPVPNGSLHSRLLRRRDRCQEAMSALPRIATAKADSRKTSCPLYPRKQTCAVQLRMSAKGQKRTLQTSLNCFRRREQPVSVNVRPNVFVVRHLRTRSDAASYYAASPWSAFAPLGEMPAHSVTVASHAMHSNVRR
jgi:hypothetical protein